MEGCHYKYSCNQWNIFPSASILRNTILLISKYNTMAFENSLLGKPRIIKNDWHLTDSGSFSFVSFLQKYLKLKWIQALALIKVPLRVHTISFFFHWLLYSPSLKARYFICNSKDLIVKKKQKYESRHESQWAT